jgi:hypothetical protein
MDAKAVLDERGRCGRRNRVVLISRRWDQAYRGERRATEAIKPGLRGEHEDKPLKPLRRECRIVSAACGD